MEITAQMVSRLREQSGAGMMECKKALIEASGDGQKALDILRVKGKAGAEKRSGRATSEGVVAAALTPAGGGLVELNSETDFVARNDEFRSLAQALADTCAATTDPTPSAVLACTQDGRTLQQGLDDVVARLRENIGFRRCARFAAGADSVVATYVHTVNHKIAVMVELQGDPSNTDHAALARNVAMHIAAAKPTYVSRDDVPADVVERERTVLADRTREEGKPEAAIAKIVEGRLGKFYELVALVDQPYVREPSTKIGQLVSAAGAQVRRFVLYTVGQE